MKFGKVEGLNRENLVSVPGKPTPLSGVGAPHPNGIIIPRGFLNIIFIELLNSKPPTMSESYIEIENRISEAYDAYSARGKPKIKPLSQKFNVPYKRLLSRINGRDS